VNRRPAALREVRRWGTGRVSPAVPETVSFPSGGCRSGSPGYSPAVTTTAKPGYVLPLRCERDADLTELTAYLYWLREHSG
jgi:hypothetical protein